MHGRHDRPRAAFRRDRLGEEVRHHPALGTDVDRLRACCSTPPTRVRSRRSTRPTATVCGRSTSAPARMAASSRTRRMASSTSPSRPVTGRMSAVPCWPSGAAIRSSTTRKPLRSSLSNCRKGLLLQTTCGARKRSASHFSEWRRVHERIQDSQVCGRGGVRHVGQRRHSCPRQRRKRFPNTTIRRSHRGQVGQPLRRGRGGHQAGPQAIQHLLLRSAMVPRPTGLRRASAIMLPISGCSTRAITNSLALSSKALSTSRCRHGASISTVTRSLPLAPIWKPWPSKAPSGQRRSEQ